MARDYVPNWHWSDGESLKVPLAQVHGRVAHLGVIRAPVEEEGDFQWSEFIVLRDKPIPIIRSHNASMRFPYAIFYVPLGNRIDIWRVLHTHRDIPGTFADH